MMATCNDGNFKGIETMKNFLFVLTMLAAASASSAFGDTLSSIETLTWEFGSATTNQPEVNGVYCGPYQYVISGAAVVSPATTLVVPNGTVNGFCIDYTTPTPVGQNYSENVYQLSCTGGTISGTASDIVALNNAEKAVIQLVGYYVQIQGNTLPPQLSYGSTQQNDALGLQLALWDVINGVAVPSSSSAFNISDGSAANAAIAEANLLLDNYTTAPTTTPVYAIVTPGEQIQGIVFGSQTKVPEPVGIVAIASLGLCGLPIGLARFFRRRRQRAEGTTPRGERGGLGMSSDYRHRKRSGQLA